MTIITQVGVSYVDDMNDDVPEADRFSRECYQAPPLLILVSTLINADAQTIFHVQRLNFTSVNIFYRK